MLNPLDDVLKTFITEPYKALVTMPAAGVTLDSAALSPDERAGMMYDIEIYAAQRMELANAMLEGIVLGAEQVQDKQIEFASAGGEKAAGLDALVEIVMGIVLEGTPVEFGAALVARKMIVPLLSNMKRAAQETLKAKAAAFRADSEMLSAARQWALAVAEDQSKWVLIDAQSNEQANEAKDQYVRSIKGPVSNLQLAQALASTWSKFGSKITKTAIKVADVKGKPVSAGSTTARVSIVGSAMQSASSLRMTITTARALNIYLLRSANRETASWLLKSFKPDEVDVQLIRDTYMTTSEGLIWATNLSISDPKVGTEQLTHAIDDIRRLPVSSDRLRAYLTARFSGPALRWAEKVQIQFAPPLPAPGSPAGGVPASSERGKGISKIPAGEPGVAGATDDQDSQNRAALLSQTETLVYYYLAGLHSSADAIENLARLGREGSGAGGK